MKHLLFSVKIINNSENHKGFILAREGKASVRGIFIGTCFNKKETDK